jgi:hypothetical protein
MDSQITGIGYASRAEQRLAAECMLWFLIRLALGLSPPGQGQCFATSYIGSPIFQAIFNISLTSPPISLIFRAVICSQLFQLKCGYFSGLLVLLADEVRLSSSRRVLEPLGGSPCPPNFPSKRHGKLSASNICGTAWR